MDRVVGRRLSRVASVTLPALFFAWQVWQRRWVSDDGQINARIVAQVLAGHGPVFNAGERVESGTSTLWLLLVTLGRAVAPGLETGQVMVALGTALSFVAVLLMGLAALPLVPSERMVLPLGSAVFVSIAAFWDFGTSGLETSLSMAWLSASMWLLVRAAMAKRSFKHSAWAAFVIGLGPLIRPDFAPVALVFGVGLVVFQGVRPLRWLGLSAIALALPLAYEVFRAGFYACLVPNTALAKASPGGRAGLAYVGDFLGTYWFAVPLAVVLAGLARVFFGPDRVTGQRWLVGLPVLASGLYLAFVVMVGGDFMHGRFMIPSAALLLLPVGVVGAPRKRWGWLAAAVVLVWSIAAIASLRPVPGPVISDERSYYLALTHQVDAPPGALAIQESWANSDDYQAGLRAQADRQRGSSYLRLADGSTVPLGAPGAGVVYWNKGAMVVGLAAPDVPIYDAMSLTDPIGARLTLRPGTEFRVGHVMKPDNWIKARFGVVGPDAPEQVVAARDALQCDAIPQLLEAISAPLTVDRFVRNLALAPRFTTLRFPADAIEARRQLCAEG